LKVSIVEVAEILVEAVRLVAGVVVQMIQAAQAVIVAQAQVVIKNAT
jgi:hypothetical protein